MRLIEWVLVILTAIICVEQARGEAARTSDNLNADDDSAGTHFGYTPRQLRANHARYRQKTPSEQLKSYVANALETEGERGKVVDSSVAQLIKIAGIVLRAKGFPREADEIESEYLLYYYDAFSCLETNCVKSGNHPPMSEWLNKVHHTIHYKIGEFLCKYFHFHDLDILNYGVGVVFTPQKYDLKHYTEHFAGEINFGWFWNFHGVAGVVTFWTVQGVCSAGTSGMGAVSFICGAIAGWAENGMDKYIAPKLASRIWERAHQE